MFVDRTLDAETREGTPVSIRGAGGAGGNGGIGGPGALGGLYGGSGEQDDGSNGAPGGAGGTGGRDQPGGVSGSISSVIRSAAATFSGEFRMPSTCMVSGSQISPPWASTRLMRARCAQATS